jgi:hypothetical protein
MHFQQTSIRPVTTIVSLQWHHCIATTCKPSVAAMSSTRASKGYDNVIMIISTVLATIDGCAVINMIVIPKKLFKPYINFNLKYSFKYTSK